MKERKKAPFLRTPCSLH